MSINIAVYGYDDFPDTVFSLAEDFSLKLWFCEDEKSKQQQSIKNISYPIEAISYNFFTQNFLPECNICAPRKIKNDLKNDHLEYFLGMTLRHYASFRGSDLMLRYFSNDINFFYYLIDFFYEKITKNKIDLLIFCNVPHEGGDYLLYILAKYLGIKTLMSYQTIFENRYFTFENIEDLNDLGKHCQVVGENHLPEIKKSQPQNLWYMKNIKDASVYKKLLDKKIASTAMSILFRVLFLRFKSTKKRLLRISQNLLKLEELKNYITNYQNTIDHDIDYSQKFIYFALHYQPEKTSVPEGKQYYDQITALEELSNIIPDDFYIYVKENPKQDEIFRGNDFFARLRKIKKVKFLPINVSSQYLIDKSQIVGTLTGTVGFEALLCEKPVIVFGYAWYNCLPFVYKFDEGINISNILSQKFDFRLLKQSFCNLMSRSNIGVCDNDYKEIVDNFDIKNNQKILTNNLKTKIKEIF